MRRDYQILEVSGSLAETELDVLRQWKEQDVFHRSVRGARDYVFYDGPPFANGLPHYGHLLTGFIKDTFARYHTMLGCKVERRFGWDCHGLPAEMAAEKELGISGKTQIENFGIGKFNDYCRSSVLRYTGEWQLYVERQARWVDFENDYKTMDRNYMESVIWAFKELYNKGLIYESMRVMPYSWACQTPVSDFETRMDNAYKEKQSKAITVAFQLKQPLEFLPDFPVYCVIWTTTPWTLPSNLAIAVGRDIDYVAILKEEKIYIIAKALAQKFCGELGVNFLAEFKGSRLLGLCYRPLFEYFAEHKNAFVILHGDFVNVEDGTGLVHMAPGFGEDDYNLCQLSGIDIVCPVDSAGKFTSPVVDYIGQHVFDANDQIIIRLKQQGAWLRTEQYLHNYPHCWRTDTPLIYKAIPSWYVNVVAIRDKMVENNKQINWIPEHIKEGLFGKWLENARDWSISRNRYWGCPIPVWQSDDPQYPHIEVYGSIAELEAAFGVQVNDLHRPLIDNLTKANPADPTGKSKLRRVPEVLDCWFESGSMPYAQLHYPFENREVFEKNFPADFIVEYVSQTRGWFYTLMVLATALFDKPPFLNCICHGVILGGDGAKLSKRLKNYADPNEVFATIGADPLRWFMLSSPVMKGKELLIDAEANSVKEVLRLFIKPILNSYNFFALYANADKLDEIKEVFLSEESLSLIDRYILSKCFMTVRSVKTAMDAYDTGSATRAVEQFFEVLTNWYIRRSRERFWSSEVDNPHKIAAYRTLYTVLHTMCRAFAPLLPLTAEAVFLALSRNAQNSSVHLERFPEVQETLINESLMRDMDRVMDACNAVLHLRNTLGIRVRQPLRKATFIGVAADNAEMQQLVLDEINVKSWENLPESEIEKYAHLKLKLNLPQLGKRLPDRVKECIALAKEGRWSRVGSSVLIAGIELSPEEFAIKLEAKSEFALFSNTLASGDALVMLDIEITEELRDEGIARDLVRIIQQRRKELGFNVTDTVYILMESGSALIERVLLAWEKYICEQTLGIFVDESRMTNSAQSVSYEVAECQVEINLRLAS